MVCYSTYLLLKYNCHINIETCVSMKGIMYLHDENPVKHVRCGHDDANLAPALKRGVSSRYSDVCKSCSSSQTPHDHGSPLVSYDCVIGECVNLLCESFSDVWL